MSSFMWCMTVHIVITLSWVGVSTGVYFYTAGQEEATFENRFVQESNKVLEDIGQNIERTLGSLDSPAVTLTSYAHTNNMSWPFVTLPNFAVALSKILPLTNAAYITVNPVVTPKQRKKWEDYALKNQFWVNETMAFQAAWKKYYGPIIYDWTPDPVIHGNDGDEPHNVSRVLLPSWQSFPVVPRFAPYSWDNLDIAHPEAALACLGKHTSVVSQAYMLPNRDDSAAKKAETKAMTDWIRDYIEQGEEPVEPISDIFYPIVNGMDEVKVVVAEGHDYANHEIIGVISTSFYWRAMIRGSLSPGSDGIVVVFDSPCNDPFTYEINGPSVKYLGVGDKHDPKYDRLGVHGKLFSLVQFSNSDSIYSGAGLDEEFCPFTLNVYPSDVMKAECTTKIPLIFAWSTALIFALTALVFCLYDLAVERRQKLVLKTALRSTALVSSLFPSTVRERLYQSESEKGANRNQSLVSCRMATTENDVNTSRLGSPIAELYPETTVMFADIAGFTAWSSERQPHQVFHLLETLYGAFDRIAKQRGVFKVETIGDSYVAVVGLPTPRKQHAVVMARFAKDCRDKMNELTRELEKTLGPGTADLALRLGLNSGPATAGVFRGEKARFQLFGDTINTAARMESNGERNRIQVSQKTADLIELANKGHWLTPRKDKVNAKGKGQMQTYWCEPKSGTNSTGSESQGSSSTSEKEKFVKTTMTPQEELMRLVEWNVDLFEGLLKKVMANQSGVNSTTASATLDASAARLFSGRPLDEVTEIVSLPKASPVSHHAPPADTKLSTAALEQLRDFILSIAEMHRANPFHNFDHCCHVTMATMKLLNRIALENCPYGISSDPLTQFAVAFGSLMHDVDHPGVSNAQLVQENAVLAVTYDCKSVSEQHSVDVAWNMFMEPRFADLRACIYSAETELKRFRQVVINIVMATDFFDKDVEALRESRWNKSFCIEPTSEHAWPCNKEESDRRAAIILDIIIQAADISHAMQHFTVYKKWSLRLLAEMYNAYKSGRSLQDPIDGWYERELTYFDSYVIPLSAKLRKIGVFGASCDEFLDYAKDNRVEWEMTGREIVREANEALEAQALGESLSEDLMKCASHE